ncbi:MAG: hypothetical protein BAJALOKI1v1_680008 [Promethearchaeota archaeon]|nr:MAG: hypothetical protein BAJALOKI1v1_680008 [Candidatus Lokiarchaeota archaeon]
MELFKQNITVDSISSDLEYWKCELQSKEEAMQLMKDENYDLLVIKKGEKILKKVLTKDKKILEITNEQIISENLPITDLLNKFINKQIRHYFLNKEGEINKIITIGDLQKGPARLLLFGLIMNFEVVCIDFIIKYAPNWETLLDSKVLKKIEKKYKSLKAKDLDINKLHCSFIIDKIEIIKQTEMFEDFCLICKRDKGDIRYILKKLKDFRNNLAHSNHMRAKFDDWADLLESIRICRIFTNEMRKLL